MSLFWSQWIPKYYTANTVKWLRDDWKITVVRAAMAVKPDGYEKNPDKERNKVIAVVDAAIHLGIYVIIDYQPTPRMRIAPRRRRSSPKWPADTATRPMCSTSLITNR